MRQPPPSVPALSLSASELDCLLANALSPLNAPRAIEMLALGANPNAKLPAFSQSALYLMALSCEPGSARVLEALLRFGANPRAVLGGSQSTPLHAVCGAFDLSSESFEKATLLAQAGADLNAPDSDGRSPLLTLALYCPAGALDERRALIARHLVGLGADLHWRDHYGDSAFDIALHAPGQGGSAALALLRELSRLGAVPRQGSLERPSRQNPSEEFLLFAQSLIDQEALASCVPAAPASPSPRL